MEREGVFGAGSGGREERLNEFETSLPIRLDYEACLAYLLLPPAGGVLLLLCEQKSDYVRYAVPIPCLSPWYFVFSTNTLSIIRNEMREEKKKRRNES